MNTAQDLVGTILAATGGGGQDGEHHAVRQAVIYGVREVMQCREWLWHTRTGSFDTRIVSTVGAVSAGSNQINVLDGSEFVPGRIVTVSGGGFSDNTRIVAVNGNTITVDRAATSTATGVDVRPQIFYDLPADLKDIDALSTNTVGTLHCYISPQEWQRLEINTRGAGEPYYYTVMRSDLNPDRYQVRFVGVPQSETTVHYTYRITPKPIKYFGYERICREGTVAVVQENGQMVVSGTGTHFPQDVSGCFIRFGEPGMPADPVGSTNPFIMERRIESWQSETKLLISDRSVYERPGVSGPPTEMVNFDGGVVVYPQSPTVIDGNTSEDYDTGLYTHINTTLPANTQYAITDVIDASPQMYTAIFSACEVWYARLAGKPGDQAMALFNRDLRIAMENDTVSPMSGRATGPNPTPRSMGWHSYLLPDVN